MLIGAKNKFIKSNNAYIEKYICNHFSVEKNDLDDAKRLFAIGDLSNPSCVNISLNHELFSSSSSIWNKFNTNDFIHHILSYVKKNV